MYVYIYIINNMFNCICVRVWTTNTTSLNGLLVRIEDLLSPCMPLHSLAFQSVNFRKPFAKHFMVVQNENKKMKHTVTEQRNINTQPEATQVKRSLGVTIIAIWIAFARFISNKWLRH